MPHGIKMACMDDTFKIVSISSM